MRNSGHYQPELAENAPSYNIIHVSVQDQYYDILVVCHSCDEWKGHNINVRSDAQAMIYSAHVRAKMQTTNKTAYLSPHIDYGTSGIECTWYFVAESLSPALFRIDMNQIHSEATSPVIPEFAKNGRKSAGLYGSLSQRHAWQKYHGISMITSFTIIIPFAVIYLRSGMPKAFTVHWTIQFVATLIVFSSATFAIIESWNAFKVFSNFQLTNCLC